MKVCFVGFENLPVLAREYNHHGNGGAQLQQTCSPRHSLLADTRFPWSSGITVSHTQQPGTVSQPTKRIVRMRVFRYFVLFIPVGPQRGWR